MRKRMTTTLIMLALILGVLLPTTRPQAKVLSSQIADLNNAPLSQIITSTPDKDGIVVHVVKDGETLWAIAIAYGTTGAEILVNSGINPNATDVFVGQVLTIYTAASATATLTPTETPIPPTPTNTPIRPTRTPLPSLTPGPTATATDRPPLIIQTFGDGKSVGIGLMAVCGLGLLLVVFFGFIKKSEN